MNFFKETGDCTTREPTNMKIKIAGLILLGIITFSCGKEEINNDWVYVSGLEVYTVQESKQVFIVFQTIENFQCPSPLEIISKSVSEDQIEVTLSDQVHHESRCFAVYRPRPAIASISIENPEKMSIIPLKVNFKSHQVNGTLQVGDNPQILLEENCCLQLLVH